MGTSLGQCAAIGVGFAAGMVVVMAGVALLVSWGRQRMRWRFAREQEELQERLLYTERQRAEFELEGAVCVVWLNCCLA